MNFEDYQAINAINASFLKACSFGPWHGYKQLHDPFKPTDAMEFGSAVHCALLEPEKFDRDYVLIPFDAPKKPTRAQIEAKKPSDKTVAAIAWWDAFNAKNEGKNVLDANDQDKINRIKLRCYQIDIVRNALDSFEKEKSYQLKVGGFDFKGRLDLVDDANGVIIDVKTTRDASPREFVSQSLALRYDIQLHHYAALMGKDCTVYVIAIESESGQVACYDMTDIVYSDFTKNRYAAALNTAKDVILMTECPPKFKPEIVNLTLPEWALKESVV